MIAKIYSGGDKPDVKNQTGATQKKTSRGGRKKKDTESTSNPTQALMEIDDITTATTSTTTATAKPTQRGRAGSVKKPAPMKFAYVYRLSYSCTLELLEITFGYLERLFKLKKLKIKYNSNLIRKENQNESRVKLESSHRLDETMVESLRNDNVFKTYLLGILDQQLEDLLADSLSSKNKSSTTVCRVYDCECFNDKQLFDYLLRNWG